MYVVNILNIHYKYGTDFILESINFSLLLALS